MKIYVELSEWLKRFAGGERNLVLDFYDTIESGSITGNEAIKMIGIPMDEVGFISVNGVKSNMTDTLKDGDKVAVFHPIIGG